MTQWFVKDLSKLTKVSVQTLHHYDRIGLLKPSARLSNGYRVYSEKDLLKLQQIIALKFFGFELLKIKDLLAGETATVDHLLAQSQVLEQKAKTLLDASNTLKSIISDVADNQSINWKTIIKLIEVYNMTQQLDHAWVKEILTPEEFIQYAEFRNELAANSTNIQKETFEKDWDHLVKEMQSNLQTDPHSAIGIKLGERCMVLINGLYGKKHANLRTKIFEQGFGEGKGLDEVGLTPELVQWLDKAVDAYWHDRLYGILARIGKDESADVLKLWNEALDDMYGEDKSRKHIIIDMAMQDDNVSDAAKQWLKTVAYH